MNTGQNGMALIEALVASAILGIGMVGATQLAVQGLNTATETRQRQTAHSLALEAMDCHQTQGPACPMDDTISRAGSLYSRQTQRQPRPGLALVDITVTVQWTSAARVGPNGQAMATHNSTLVLHSSRAAVPVWVGVSLP